MWGSKRKEKEEELKKQLEVMTLKLDLLKLSMKYGVAFFEEFKGEKEKVRIFELPKVKPNFRVELLGLFNTEMLIDTIYDLNTHEGLHSLSSGFYKPYINVKFLGVDEMNNVCFAKEIVNSEHEYIYLKFYVKIGENMYEDFKVKYAEASKGAEKQMLERRKAKKD